MSYPVQSCATDAEQAAKARDAGWKVDYPRLPVEQTQSCDRGEHMYETGRRTCPLCGDEL